MVLANITALDVAFVSAISAVAGSVAGPLISFLIARGDRSHQRGLSREERSFESRRAVYEDTLAEVGEEIYVVREYLKKVERARVKVEASTEYEVEADLIKEWSRSRGRLATVAGEPVMTAYEDFRQAATDWWAKLLEVTSEGTVGDNVDPARAEELRPLQAELAGKRLDLEALVRRDLQGD